MATWKKWGSVWVVLLVTLSLVPIGASAQSGWLTGWTNRNPVTVTNSAGSTLSNFQINIVAGASLDFTKAKSGGSDVRVTSSDGQTLIPFWIENWSPGTSSASIWVKVPSIPTTGTTVYVYYGNAAASTVSSGDSTFEFFDDFQTNNSSTGYFQLGAAQTEISMGSGLGTIGAAHDERRAGKQRRPHLLGLLRFTGWLRRRGFGV